MVILVLQTRIFTDIMSWVFTVIVIPEVVPGPGEEGVVVLPHGDAVLPVQVVGLTVPPVKPVHSGVHVRPVPHTRVMLVMSRLGHLV